MAGMVRGRTLIIVFTVTLVLGLLGGLLLPGTDGGSRIQHTHSQERAQ